MNEPVMYMAHDPLGNTEAQVIEFDQTLLAACEQAGIVFIAVDAAGEREIVAASEVVPPANYSGGSVALVQPVYVDERMSAVIDVFDALESVLFPQAAALSIDAETKQSASDPEKRFSDALAALKMVAAGDGE